MDLHILGEEIRQCSFCDLRGNIGDNEPITTYGDGNILVVTNPPSKENLYTEQHFTVNEKRYFDLMLKAAGIDGDDVSFTSITKCGFSKTNKANMSCLKLCTTKFLLRELRIIQPKAIISVGKIATSHFLSLSVSKLSMSKVVNSMYDYEGIPVLPIYNMSYLIQQGRKTTDNIVEQLSKIGKSKENNEFQR